MSAQVQPSGGDGGESGRENEPHNDKSQPPNETQNDSEEQTLIVNDGENTHKASQRRFNWEKVLVTTEKELLKSIDSSQTSS